MNMNNNDAQDNGDHPNRYYNNNDNNNNAYVDNILTPVPKIKLSDIPSIIMIMFIVWITIIIITLMIKLFLKIYYI